MFNLEHSDHVIVHSYARFVGTRINIKCMQFYSLTTTVEWLARQAKEAFPWKEAPRYLIRDRNRAYGAAFTRRLRAMGIPAKILALAVEMIELQCCLLWCGSLFLCRFLGRRDADAIHALGQPASEKRQGTKSREGIRVAMRRALSRTEHRT